MTWVRKGKVNVQVGPRKRNNFKKMTPRERGKFLREYKQLRGCFGCRTKKGRLLLLDYFLCPHPNLLAWVKTNEILTYQRDFRDPANTKPYFLAPLTHEPEPSNIWAELHHLTVWCPACAENQLHYPDVKAA